MRVYADHAATTPMSAGAIAALSKTMAEVYGNPSSLYTIGQEAAEVLQEAREKMASLLHCQAKELYFTSGGSEGDNQVILSTAFFGAKKGKKHLISTPIEHHAVLHALEYLEKEHGFTVTLLPVDEHGLVTAQQVEDAITPETALVTIMYANNEIGTVMPIEEIGQVCRAHKVPFHTDAVQVVGHLPIDLSTLPVDMLTLSAHKFNGPKGVGCMYVRTGTPIFNLIHGGGQERGKRAGTENIPGIVSMSVALEEAIANMETHTVHGSAMRDQLIEGLLKVPHSVLNGSPTHRLPTNAHICFEGIEGEALLLLLDAKGVSASSGSACTSGSLDPSHVLLAIGRPHEIAHGSLRLSISGETTQEEIDHILKVVPEVVTYLRSMSPVWSDLVKGKSSHVI